MTLGEKQELFTQLISKLILHMYAVGYQVRCGDFWAKERTPLEHKAGSAHYNKLAADLNLFKDGKFLDRTEDHAIFGLFWESLNPLCRWGGHFGDGNHYSILHEGRQ